MKCQNCKKGIDYGNLVSHAKNRTKRIFKPNIQKLKVLRKNVPISVRLCTKCIKRLKKDGKIGNFFVIMYKKEVEKVKLPEIKKKEEVVKKTDKKKEEMQIEDLVGNKK